MNSEEKCELCKEWIRYLYTVEGRTKFGISARFGINRQVLAAKLEEWGFKQAKVYHMAPSTEKFLSSHRDFIKSRLDKDAPLAEIALALKLNVSQLSFFISVDPVLKQASIDKNNRMHQRAEERRQNMMDKSSLEYCTEDLPGEIWKDILGYDRYQVSNFGRFRSFSTWYNCYYLIRTYVNQRLGREYIKLGDKNLIAARLVAHAFCPGFSEENCTVDHIDGNPLNNHASNLRWVSQSVNNKHAYELGRVVNIYKGPIPYEIIYKNKYHFKTITAFAKFLNLSWTQASRWIDEAEKHDIVLKYK